MAQPYVSGPIHVFVVLPTGFSTLSSSQQTNRNPAIVAGNAAAVASGGAAFALGNQTAGSASTVGSITVINRAAFYLGTTRGKPHYRHRHEYSNVMNDISGGKIPFDFLAQGTHGYQSLDFTRWNQSVMDAVCSVPNPLSVRGVNVAGDVGTAMLLEGAFIGVVWMYPYILKAAMQGGGVSGSMPAGRFWPTCLLEEDGEERGTEENAANVMFHMVHGFTPLGASVTYLNGVPSGVNLTAIN